MIRLRYWLFIYLGFAIWGVISAAGAYQWYTGAEREAPWLPFFLNYTVSWLFWPACLPLILRLCRRFNFRRPVLIRSVLVHFVVASILSVGQVYFFVLTGVLFWTTLGEWSVEGAWGLYGMPGLLYQRISFTLPLYWMVVAACLAWEYYRESRRRADRALQLQAQLARTRLDALESQLQPHFLFNALHAILSLIEDHDNARASSMLMSLSDLLRQRLDDSRQHEVPLREEMATMRRYLDMVRVRYGDRLNIETDVPDECMDGMVPSFILQPLVENAIRHGVEKTAGAHQLRIRAERTAASFRLEISNTVGAPGARECGDPGGGKGLRITHERLDALYEGNYQLRLDRARDGWAVVTLEVPYHTQPVSSPPETGTDE